MKRLKRIFWYDQISLAILLLAILTGISFFITDMSYSISHRYPWVIDTLGWSIFIFFELTAIWGGWISPVFETRNLSQISKKLEKYSPSQLKVGLKASVLSPVIYLSLCLVVYLDIYSHNNEYWGMQFTLVAMTISIMSIYAHQRYKRLKPQLDQTIMQLNFCLQCGYNLQGSTSPTCPECGHPIPGREDKPDA